MTDPMEEAERLASRIGDDGSWDEADRKEILNGVRDNPLLGRVAGCRMMEAGRPWDARNLLGRATEAGDTESAVLYVTDARLFPAGRGPDTYELWRHMADWAFDIGMERCPGFLEELERMAETDDGTAGILAYGLQRHADDLPAEFSRWTAECVDRRIPRGCTRWP